MLDKKRLAVFITLGAIVLVAFIALVAWIIGNINSAPATAPSASPTPSSSISPELAAFTPELEKVAVNVAIAASSWSSAATPEARAQQYERAGMSPEYARVYTPIWSSVFEGTKSSEVSSAVRSKPEVLDVDGDLGYLTFKVAVPIDWRASWNFGSGQQFQPGAANPWIVTVDEHTGLVTAVDQPSLDDIDITLNRP